VTVVTNDAVNFVKFDNGTTDRTYDRPNSTSSGQKTWTHTFSSMSGTIIYIDAGFTNSLDDDSLRIREILDPEVNVSFSITNSPSLINIGSSLTITVETSSEVGYIVVTDPTRNNQRTEVRDSTSIANNRRRFVYTGTPSITNQTSVSYTIEAYSGSGTRLQSTTRTVNVNR
ncbi:MAG: hypothetical protein FWE82_04705, partial [Defluviitaleaceae bacterium]|nr:hypothetical protein [Defluviitaleaceae bacterium]